MSVPRATPVEQLMSCGDVQELYTFEHPSAVVMLGLQDSSIGQFGNVECHSNGSYGHCFDVYSYSN